MLLFLAAFEALDYSAAFSEEDLELLTVLWAKGVFLLLVPLGSDWLRAEFSTSIEPTVVST